jgi:exodeoxyribonuclease V alpha subunit
MPCTCLFFTTAKWGVARRIKRIVETDSIFIHNDVEQMVASIEKKNKVRYDECPEGGHSKGRFLQIYRADRRPRHRQTFTTLGMISLYKMLGAKILLAAPTGRAAKRMSEVTGMEAKDHSSAAGI